MSLDHLLQQRYSVRAFSDRPVAKEQLETLFTAAQRAPSNCNTQPWQPYVIQGDALKRLSKALVAEIMKQNPPNPDFNWKISYSGEHRERQFGSANALYGAMGIAREDKMARNMAMLRNWTFFDAPHAVFFTMEKYLGIMGAVDLGIYAQTLSLLMKEQGIDSCMQGALGQYPDPIRELLGMPESQGILFGMSFGYAKDDADANQCRTEREPVDNAVTFIE